ncbi:hypothetical protein KY358_00100 [Candidatus Woesearchaeota archaeon]|nr:hypothetical protein [Candidatus Woesearchaeota archaeon]
MKKRSVDIKKELQDNSILLSVFSSEYYNKSVVHLFRNLNNRRVCYVTLNKTADSIAKNFSFNGIDTKNIFFIDAISSSIDKNKKMDNGILVSSPYAFTELSIAINEALNTGMFDLVIFDSLSTLNVYGNGNTSVRFTSDVINRIRAKDYKGIFTCLEKDVKSSLIEQSSMNFDKVLKFEGWYDKMKRDNLKLAGGSLAVLLGLITAFSFFNVKNNNITGLATSPTASGNPIMPFLFFIVVVTAILGVFYKKEIMLKVQNLKKVNKPRKIANKKMLGSRFRNKVYKWIDSVYSA